MGKRKIGELVGHPIIIGDKNLKNKNEIHITLLFKKDDSDVILPDDFEIATELDVELVIDSILNT